MFYSKEGHNRIEGLRKVLHSTESNGLSLCQYNNNSCVRCCLPHIGGDYPMEVSDEEFRRAFNKSNLAAELKFGGRYVGPKGVLLKFNNFHPLKQPQIHVSYFEDSFEDVGKSEMGRRFSQRQQLFKEIFDPSNPKESIQEYERQIKEIEGYNYEDNDDAGAFISLFLGGSRHVQGVLPECQMLGTLDDKVGCMAHPESGFTGGFDGRELVGFFKNDSCTRCSCYGAEEFKFLSPSALKVFDKAVEGLSWYEYSRHATNVLVGYLRVFDHVLQQIDKIGKLDDLSFADISVFTNSMYDTWPLKEPSWTHIHKAGDFRLPFFPVPNVLLSSEITDWSDSGDSADSEKVECNVLTTTQGYVIDIVGKDQIKIRIVDGNKPKVKRNGLSRFQPGYCGGSLSKVINFLSKSYRYSRTSQRGSRILNMDLPIKEKIFYMGIKSIFLDEMVDAQLQQAQDEINNRISSL